MRTTLDIDEDVLLAAKERARREGKTAGQVLSQLARQALVQGTIQHLDRQPGLGEERAVFGLRPIPSRGGIVTNDAIDRLREEDVY
ncbi:MAG: hypothetical protein KF911_13230 [Pseudomonadales bacterium]|nr:hypothetical protein [Pseudomonadales bacterium]